MDFNTKILLPENIEEILEFEKAIHFAADADPMELEMATWDALWRKEALEHYLPLGWSFGVWDDEGKLAGYFIGQPFLFFRGMTQTLWVEHLNALNEDVKAHLVDVAYRTSREKHFQKVIYFKPENYKNIVEELKKNSVVDDLLIEVKTAKF